LVLYLYVFGFPPFNRIVSLTLFQLTRSVWLWEGRTVRVPGYLLCSFPKIPEQSFPYNCYLKDSQDSHNLDDLIGVKWKEVDWSLDEKKVTVVGVIRTGYWGYFKASDKLTFYIEAKTVEPYA
jgi:hypothetical protein